MSALPSEDHFVYVHRDADARVLYVGRTKHPDSRPFDTRGRPWQADVAETFVSPPMPYEAACWVEDHLLMAAEPPHNVRRGRVEFDNPQARHVRKS